jgi:hypothetical protein
VDAEQAVDGELSDSNDDDDEPGDRVADDGDVSVRPSRRAFDADVQDGDKVLPPLQVLPLFANLPVAQQAKVKTKTNRLKPNGI